MKDIIEKLNNYLNEKELTLVKITVWESLDEKSSDDYYTYTDGKNYPLTKDGSIFLSDEKDAKIIKDLDGEPSSKSKKVIVAKLNNVFGLFDSNLKLVKKFKDLNELAEELIDALESSKKVPFDFEEFYVGKYYKSDFENLMKGGRF